MNFHFLHGEKEREHIFGYQLGLLPTHGNVDNIKKTSNNRVGNLLWIFNNSEQHSSIDNNTHQPFCLIKFMSKKIPGLKLAITKST